MLESLIVTFLKLLPVVIIIALVAGWIMCLIAFCSCDFSSSGSFKAEVIYGIGTFTPLGAILGWFNFGK